MLKYIFTGMVITALAVMTIGTFLWTPIGSGAFIAPLLLLLVLVTLTIEDIVSLL